MLCWLPLNNSVSLPKAHVCVCVCVLTGGELLYKVVLVSAAQKRESMEGIHKSPPSSTTPPTPHIAPQHRSLLEKCKSKRP